MGTKTGRIFLAFCVLALAAAPGRAAPRLDLDADIGLKYNSYKNLGYTTPASPSQTFISHRMQMALSLTRIPLEGSEDSTLDIGFALAAFGIAGSTLAVPVPFDRAAQRFPSTGLSPFISQAYIGINRTWGGAWGFTLGRVPFRLGTGLLLSDDEAGFTGAIAKRRLPAEQELLFYFFEPRAQPGTGGNIDVYGVTLKSPGVDGDWTISELLESDHLSSGQLGRPVKLINRGFTSLSYAMQSNGVSFEGEAAVEYGTAKSASTLPNVKLSGQAFNFKTTWKNSINHNIFEGKFYLGRGSGDKASTPNIDESFFPTSGHRFNGLQRSGAGDFFAATPYDAQGSSASLTGLPDGVSGIQYYGLGVTFPDYQDIIFDLDYFVFSAAHTTSGFKDLGSEVDFSAKYQIKGQFTFKVLAAFFKAGQALNPSKPSARRISALVSGRF